MKHKKPYRRLKTKRVINSFTRNEIVLQALLVGALAGLLAVAFRLSIHSISDFISHKTATLSGLTVLLIPFITALGGLIAGILIQKIAPEAQGSGIPHVKSVLSSINDKVRLRSVFTKFIAGVLGIGTGLSLGREGPSVQLGAGAGSFVSRIFKMNGSKRNKMIAAGAGSAIAATFNAPIAATIFVIEELVHFFSSALLFPVLIATVAASTVARFFLGNRPAFDIPEYLIPLSAESLPAFVILGIAAGFIGVWFSKTIIKSVNSFGKVKNIPEWAKPGLAGFVVGSIGVLLPSVLGPGNAAITELLSGNIPLLLVGIIFAAKFFLTAYCFGSGATGGLFLPTLMLGAFMGYFIGLLSNQIGLNVDPVIVSLVGMGAFLSSVVRTPLTAVVIVFEMTGDYNHILPIMLSAAIADLIAEKMHSPSIYNTLVKYRARKSKQAETQKLLNEEKAPQPIA